MWFLRPLLPNFRKYLSGFHQSIQVFNRAPNTTLVQDGCGITNEILTWKKQSNSQTLRSSRRRQSGCRTSRSTNSLTLTTIAFSPKDSGTPRSRKLTNKPKTKVYTIMWNRDLETVDLQPSKLMPCRVRWSTLPNARKLSFRPMISTHSLANNFKGMIQPYSHYSKAYGANPLSLPRRRLKCRRWIRSRSRWIVSLLRRSSEEIESPWSNG